MLLVYFIHDDNRVKSSLPTHIQSVSLRFMVWVLTGRSTPSPPQTWTRQFEINDKNWYKRNPSMF